MRKFLLALFCLLATLPTFADIFQYTYEGQTLKYYLNPEGICMVDRNSSSISGAVSIPDEVSYNGKEYTVSQIDMLAFDGCKDLTSVTIPNTITHIGGAAFRDCTSLTSITIPASVTYIGARAFSGCVKITSINIPKTVTSLGHSAFRGCTSLASIDLPPGITKIGSSSFDNCTSLTSITIPDSVISIERYAFMHCPSLQEVTFGSSLKDLDHGAFYDTPTVKKITTRAVIPPTIITTESPKSVPKNCELVVPMGSLEAYRNASWWNELASIKEDLKYSISFQMSGSGILKCNGLVSSSISVSHAGSAVISITPNPGWILKRLLVNDVDVTDKVANNEYRIENVKADHTVSAVFVERPINLTIKYPGIGTAVHTLPKGIQFTTNFVAEDGWYLASASWNGEDVTSKFSDGDKFTTPVLNADAELSIILKKGESAMQSVFNDLVKITAFNGAINVIGAETGTQVSVTDIKGNTIINTEISDSNQTINLNKNGVFIVNVADTTYKVAL